MAGQGVALPAGTDSADLAGCWGRRGRPGAATPSVCVRPPLWSAHSSDPPAFIALGRKGKEVRHLLLLQRVVVAL